MFLYVSRPYLSPLTPVTLVSVVSSGEMVVVLFHHPLVRRAVLLAVIAEVRAIWIAAGPLRFSWHDFHFLAKQKPRISPRPASLFSFVRVTIAQGKCDKLCQSVPTFIPARKNSAVPTRGYGERYVPTRSRCRRYLPRYIHRHSGSAARAVRHGRKAG